MTISGLALAAGVDVLMSELGTGAGSLGGHFNPEEVVRKIVERVAEFSPPPVARQANMTLKLDTSDLQRVVDEFGAIVADFRVAIEGLPTEDERTDQ